MKSKTIVFLLILAPSLSLVFGFITGRYTLIDAIPGVSILFCFFGWRLFVSISIKNKRKNILKNIGLNKEHSKYPVRYASKKRFEKIIKFFPWESCGILFITNDSVVYKDVKYDIFNLNFPLHSSRAWWVGSKALNGASEWFAIIDDNNRKIHYFTADTGVVVFDSEQKTKLIYDEVRCLF